MTALVIAEHDNQTLKSATLNLVSAASQCATEIHILVAGSDCSAVAEQAAKVSKVTKVLLIDDVSLVHGLSENLAEQVLAIAKNYTHILFSTTAQGKSTAPRVAARLDVSQLSDVIKIVSVDTFDRQIYAGNAIATVRSGDSIKVLTVRTTAFDAAAHEGSASIHNETVQPSFTKTTYIGCEIVKNDRPELGDARIVISGGRGLVSKEKFMELMLPLADKLGAALGASRAAVDAGFAPNDWQVGQTGKIVAPDLYIALGISGAIQHLAGMKDSKVIVAINKDGDAPIFGVADFGLVADVFTAIPELIQLLE
jgi:electron transfer flavoprotein alpha subunit